MTGRALRLAVCAFAVFFTCLTVAAQETDRPQPGKALLKNVKYCRNYLGEVRMHLRNSFIDGEKLTDADLVGACAEGFAEAMGSKQFEAVPEAARKDLAAMFLKGHESIDKLLDDLTDYLAAKPMDALNLVELADCGARSMVESVGDPFSRLLAADDLQKLMEMLSGEGRDESIGLMVMPDGDVWKVAYVMYGRIAYEAGIEMDDEVIEVNGRSLKGMDPKAVNEMLQAKPGVTVKIKLNRKGWLHPYELALVQKESAPGSTVHKMLPGGIGYLRLTIFDNTLEGSVKRALKYLKDQGMKGLILDLRNNPGGMLPAAVAVADLFIKDGRLMTTTFNRYAPQFPIPGFKEIAEMMGGMKQGEEKFTAHVATAYEDMPVVVLTNRASASASEMLSGALQDDGRAILIGEKTYGKGIGQTAVPLWKTGFPPGRFLYLTVMKYYLPGGRCINHIGIPPNIEQPADTLSGELFDGVFKLCSGGALEKYIEHQYAADPKLFYDKDTKLGLAVYDGFDCSKYPGFDAWFAGLDTKLSKDRVRDELRRAIRARVQKDHKFAFACDLETDQQLQRAVVEVRRMMGGKK